MKRIGSCKGCFYCVALGPLALIAASAVIAARAQSPILLEREAQAFLESTSVKTAEAVGLLFDFSPQTMKNSGDYNAKNTDGGSIEDDGKN